MREKWRVANDFKNYSVSTFGRVRGAKPLKPYWNDRRGYFYISIQRSGKRKNFALHRLVAETFLGIRPGLEVNHKDGDPKNNHLTNLEWVTRSENQKHAHALGLHGKPPGNRKFSDVRIVMIRVLKRDGQLHRQIALTLGMGISTVTHILRGSRR